MRVSASDIEYTDTDYRNARWLAWLMGIAPDQVIVCQYYEGKYRLKAEARARMAEQHRAISWRYPDRADT